MTIGRLLYLAAAVILLSDGIGSPLTPNPGIWGLFCVATGLFFGNTPVRRFW